MLLSIDGIFAISSCVMFATINHKTDTTYTTYTIPMNFKPWGNIYQYLIVMFKLHRRPNAPLMFASERARWRGLLLDDDLDPGDDAAGARIRVTAALKAPRHGWNRNSKIHSHSIMFISKNTHFCKISNAPLLLNSSTLMFACADLFPSVSPLPQCFLPRCIYVVFWFYGACDKISISAFASDCQIGLKQGFKQLSNVASNFWTFIFIGFYFLIAPN